ncbi:AAA family ATPase [uncultured Metabacillus sp.]|uniref:AAA family ATPase n=1 Tax=uncultured Metabacillus sp. TaxID=2860135 RepID=UPI002633C814|nr:AAA family ATPase [uncultured Metabacillus sp.]
MDKKLPLFIVTGASGTGKSTVVPYIRELLEDLDVFDIDVIQHDVEDWQKLKNIWVKVASHIAKSQRMTVLCGTMLPWEVEKCDDFQEFSKIYYVNLHCDDQTREKRLRDRGWSTELIQEHKDFAKWLIENADEAFDPIMPTIETTYTPINEVALKIKEWVTKYAE